MHSMPVRRGVALTIVAIPCWKARNSQPLPVLYHEVEFRVLIFVADARVRYEQNVSLELAEDPLCH